MTTERSKVPRLRWSSFEWRLVLTGVLASAWSAAVVLEAVPAAPSAPQAPEPVVAERPGPRWLEQLPVAERPPVTPPLGWVVTALPMAPGLRAAPAPAVAVTPTKAQRRAWRVRTRSS